MSEHPPRVAIVGADMPFGEEILARLEADGFDVERHLDGVGPLGALIVNAPVEIAQLRFEEISDDQFRAALQSQLYGPVAAAQAAAKRLVDGGTIVHIASRAHLGGWGGAHQMAAGAALIGMSRSMALELAEADVRVNCVTPDFVGMEWDTREARAELANVVGFLASPSSAPISGEVILLDRARSLRMTEAARR
jgi:3-oxoacyl-[acyl-carrier protein] reductase